ncbi:MAG TPA: transcriptional regulator [bacterium]|nr:transcriptional regulator [bacterium]
MKNLYRLTDGKILKEIPAKVLRTSYQNITMGVLSEKLIELETSGYINTTKRIVNGKPEILSVELTTYGKILFEKEQSLSVSLRDRDE